eukprot:5570868-Amphidinium_carterae.3
MQNGPHHLFSQEMLLSSTSLGCCALEVLALDAALQKCSFHVHHLPFPGSAPSKPLPLASIRVRELIVRRTLSLEA